MANRTVGARVIIIGAGPTGLATAIELGRRGIVCTIMERNERTGYAPRAKTTHVRTREFMRVWGIADKLAEAAPFGIDYPTHVHYVTRLNGYSLAVFENAINGSPAQDERYSEHGQWLPQYTVEAVMREHALSLGTVSLEYGREFLSLEQDESEVRVRTRSVSTGDEYVEACDFLVGADGARSAVRDQIGSEMQGDYGLSRNYNIIFEAPGLAEAHHHGPGIMYWQVNSDCPSVVGPMDKDDLWFFMPWMLPRDVTLNAAEAAAMIRTATGIDSPYRVLSSDEWVANRLVADKHREGRVFLAGDACHLHPPLGGFGMNMGVADGVDLGWKIAAFLHGWGGPVLLDSYEAERQPTHQHVVDEAARHHSSIPNHFMRPALEAATEEGAVMREEIGALISKQKASEFNALGFVLGCRYLHSPVITLEQEEPGWRPTTDYEPNAAPGSLAPHIWLEDGRSLYDLFGDGFTLLVIGEGNTEDVVEATQEASSNNIPLKVVQLYNARLADLYETRLALIRPDQYVAWRGDSWPETGLLAHVAGFETEKAVGECSPNPARLPL